MKKALFLLIFSLNILYCCAQGPSIQWQKSLGGSNREEANSVQQTSDGGYIVAGISGSTDGDVGGLHIIDSIYSDCWVVKLNSSGTIQWQKCLGGTNDERAFCIQQTNDGGYIMAGSTFSNDGDVTGNHDTTGLTNDYWIVKLDANGNIQWQKCLGGSWADEANSVQQTSDGGYIVAGWSDSNDGDVSGNHASTDYWIVKLDGSGNIQWQKCLGGTWPDEANSIQQTSDGGYIVAGWSDSNDGDVSGHHGTWRADFWVVKLNALGSLQWQKSLGGTQIDEANSVRQTSDAGYIIAGYEWSTDGDATGHHGTWLIDFWVVKLDTLGVIQWQKCLGGMSSDLAYSIQQTTDGGYILAGGTNSYDGDVSGTHGNGDYWLVKLDGNGNILWQKCLGGTDDDEASCIQQTSDGGYIIVGLSASNDGDVSGHHGFDFDYWVVKLSPVVGIEENESASENNLIVYPNPATSQLTILSTYNQQLSTIRVYNVLGECVMTQEPRTRNQELRLAISQLPQGIYFLQLIINTPESAAQQMITKKVVKE